MKYSTNKKSYRPRRNRKGAIGKARKIARNIKPKKVSNMEIRQIVKQVIHKTAEDKILILSLTGNSTVQSAPLPIPGSGVDWNGSVGTNGVVFTNIFPSLALGSGQGAREGNKVEPRSLQLRGVITSIPFSNMSGLQPNLIAPFYVHMFVYRQKGNIFASDTTKILQGAGLPSTQMAGNSGPFDGTLLKSTYPINRDLYNVYKHKVFKCMYYPQTVLPQNPTGGTFQLSDGWGNGFKMSHVFKINIPIKKVWKYNDSDTNLPTNDNFNVAFAVVNADNTINTPIQSRCSLVMESILRFEDV